MENELYHYTECGLDYVYLKNGFKFIETNYGKGVSIAGQIELHKIIGVNVTKLPRKLKGQEIRFLRIELDLSQKALGQILGVTDQTVARWEKNQIEIPKSDDLVLRSLYRETMEKKGKITDLIEQFSTGQSDITAIELFLEEKEQHWDVSSDSPMAA